MKKFFIYTLLTQVLSDLILLIVTLVLSFWAIGSHFIDGVFTISETILWTLGSCAVTYLFTFKFFKTRINYWKNFNKKK